ncbi:hypothetical protein M433DRAFT_149940 [Acidomyces richmondensis BFW]|nr:MAG: hypothetical protein FE78DRAFT_93178 [Acidomyces sp. 'richmondensis']KYG49526.1 hypothetical protein M433DRAFT_149940 [Acidomyces richmondensis BFW]
MDDPWIHTFTNPQPVAKEKTQHRRRASLLQQPAEENTEVAVDAIPETAEEEDPWNGPPTATLARRAQSYSNFYDAVIAAFTGKEKSLARRTSLGDLRHVAREHGSQLTFDSEFHALEAKIREASHGKYEEYHEQLQFSASYLESLLSSTMGTLTVLSTLSSYFQAVESQTGAFRDQCESLINEQKRLTELADAIDENVHYYAFLEPMTRRLNAPGAANLVKADDFPEMLSNLDRCLAYMESHPSHKEAATYRSRYRLLLTRALTLIRHYFTKSLGDIAADISRRVRGEQLKETTHSALLYAKFRVPAPELKALGLEIQKRAVPSPEDVDAGREPEYASLLRELYQSYSATRGRLMIPLVSKKMADLNSSPLQADVLAFAKASLSFMRGICLDEYDLWFEWFETDGALYEFLESLMDPVYDHLRPKIIHETRLEKLCDLCSTIQGRYMDLDSDDENDETSIFKPAANGKPQNRKLDFALLVQPALEDAQTRLVFLSISVLRDDIEAYRAKPEDVDWPKNNKTASGIQQGPVLSGKRNSVPRTPSKPATNAPVTVDQDDADITFDKSTSEEINAAGEVWYPTLPKAIWLLRRIYRLVNSIVFDDLAHRIVHSTIQSLMVASQQISAKKTAQDGQLFLIIHLLYLKQQIVAFDIEFSPPEVDFDFSSITNTFYELRERGNLWNPASWVRLVSGAVGGGLLPKVVENMLDAKAELDGRLRTVINDFVNGYANHITAPIDPARLSQAKSIRDFDALKAVRTVRGLAEKDVPALRAKLIDFVDDARIRETLVAAVRDQVLMGYEDFFETYSEDTGRKLSRKGKAREDEIWSPELFGEVMERVFQVGQMIGENLNSSSGEISD